MPKAEFPSAQVEQLKAFFRLGKINPSNRKRRDGRREILEV
jgi:hypothetical protein